MNSTLLRLHTSVRASLAIAAACAPLAGCIVNQPLGGREDGATTESDGAAPDASASAEASVPFEDGAVPIADATAMPTPTDAAAPRDASAEAAVADASTVNVQTIEISVTNARPIPALGSGSTSVQVLFRERPSAAQMSTVIERAGDCEFKETRAQSPSPPPSLEGVVIRASAPGQSPIVLRSSSGATSDNAVGRYNESFASVLAPGTIVHIEVEGFGSVPSFARDVPVAESRYIAPTPVTDNAMGRYLTRAAGQPMPVAFELMGAAQTHALFDVVMLSGESVVRELRCDFPVGRSNTTIATSLLDRAAPYANTAIGGASVLLMAVHNPASTTLSNGTTVTVASVGSTIAGLRI